MPGAGGRAATQGCAKLFSSRIAELSEGPINKQGNEVSEAACLNCGHVFTTSETTALVAVEGHDDLCIIDCAECNSHNVARVEPQGGFEEQPRLVMLRIADSPADSDKVFKETVESGTDVHPVTRGESN